MNQLALFLPCAAGVQDYLLPEALRITGLAASEAVKQRGGVQLRASWRDALLLNLLNLHSRLAQRVLVQLSHTQYRNEQDLYRAASEVAWEIWFTPEPKHPGGSDGAAQPADQPELCRVKSQRCGV